jgi:hypothetical protein
MSSVNNSVKEVQDIIQDNLQKILQRGENLHELSKKAEDLRDASALFKKRAKQVKAEVERPFIKLPHLPSKKVIQQETVTKAPSLDYLTEIEDTSISEYEQQLLTYIHEGHYQYVLDKAAQMGLINFVTHLINLSRYYPLELDIGSALKAAAFYGHIEIIELLLEHDVENERYYGKTPNIDPDSFSFYLTKIIPYTNEPLTHDDIRNSILEAHKGNHKELSNVLEKYYYRTHAIKDRHDVKKVDTFLSKLV